MFESEKAFECAQGNLLSDKGIGQDLISRVLKDMPGMTRHSIGDSLSRLKASGNYARTLTAITRQIEAEAEAARLEAERLERERQEAEARHFRRFPPVPLGGAKPAEIVQILYFLIGKLYKLRRGIVIHAGLPETGRPESRILAGNL